MLRRLFILCSSLTSAWALSTSPRTLLNGVAAQTKAWPLSASRRSHLARVAIFAATQHIPAAGATTDEVSAVLQDVRWDDENPFSRADFRRLDENDDLRFYDEPRLVYHIDAAAVAATAAFYAREFDAQLRMKSAPIDVLDVCSSWVSHYPPANVVPVGRVAGLGMNAEELKANNRLTEWVVRDLNKDPTLPYANESFDAVTCTVSVRLPRPPPCQANAQDVSNARLWCAPQIDYLTKPLAVMSEAARVLRPGGVLAIVFSNRLFFSKAVAIWTGKDDLDHVYTVGAYVHYGAGTQFGGLRAIDLTPRKQRGSKGGDPLYAVVATRQ